MIESNKNSNSDNIEIKLLESFSLPPTLMRSDQLIKTELPVKSRSKSCVLTQCENLFLLTDEHCDHTYSIRSHPSYKESKHESLESSFICSQTCLKPSLKPSVIQTGEFTMKIMNSIPIAVYKDEVEADVTQCTATTELKSTPKKYKDELKRISYMHTRSRSKPDVVHVIQPTDICVTCQQDLYSSINSSTFCLRTGNVLITCVKCATKMSLKGAFKLPKHLQCIP